MLREMFRKYFRKDSKPSDTKEAKKTLYFCPFCFKQLGPTQDCFGCGAKSLNQIFWIDESPTMSKSSVDTMDLVLWKNGNTEAPKGVAKMFTQADVPAYYYDENARLLHEEIRKENDARFNRITSH